MEFDRTGIILYTINYKECVKFYQDVLELKVMFSKDTLTCFQFGESYLMVEVSGHSAKEVAVDERYKTCLRMNVSDLRAIADKLISKNIDVDYQQHEWGTVAKFIDPDGNLCAFKDSEKFEEQVRNTDFSEF
jgi:lactoylglutathione lyase